MGDYPTPEREADVRKEIEELVRQIESGKPQDRILENRIHC